VISPSPIFTQAEVKWLMSIVQSRDSQFMLMMMMHWSNLPWGYAHDVATSLQSYADDAATPAQLLT
jgi:hypothetical protein